MEDFICISVILPLKLDWIPCYYAPKDVKRGDRVSVRFSGKVYSGVVYELGVTPQVQANKILSINKIEPLTPISEQELNLWKFAASYYLCSLGEVYKYAYPSTRTEDELKTIRQEERKEAKIDKTKQLTEAKIQKLKDRKFAKEDKLRKARKDTVKEKLFGEISQIDKEIRSLSEVLLQIEKDAENSLDIMTINRPSLSKAQAEVAQKIAASSGVSLLDGISGSGKTEIYISLAADELEKGRSVLYLLPDNLLSSQIEDRLHLAFGESLLVYGPRTSSYARRQVLSALKTGPHIILGTKKALFLPFQDLGLIVVDEEHEPLYKEMDRSPRINGRDVAVMLGKIWECSVILGSATPSLESLYNCKTGKYNHISLDKRYYAGENADLEIIDTIAEKRKNGMVGLFSRKLIARIKDALGSGDQAVILRNRRSYSPILQCEDCGDMPSCPNCNVTLSYNREANRMECHYCGHTETYTGVCGKCGGHLSPLGSGTQKVEEEAKEIFPEARIARLDGDNAKDAKKILNAFARREIDILISTQALSKGFDFEGLTLAAVIQADSMLGLDDFRADERALQFLRQLRGRCGRREKRGIMVIQTSRPTHPAYSAIDIGNDFAASQLDERKTFGYPPYTRIVRITIKDGNEARLAKLAGKLTFAISTRLKTSPSIVPDPMRPASIIGPYAPAIDRISGDYIRHIRIILKRDNALQSNKAKIYEAVIGFEKDCSYGGHIYIDVDPV